MVICHSYVMLVYQRVVVIQETLTTKEQVSYGDITSEYVDLDTSKFLVDQFPSQSAMFGTHSFAHSCWLDILLYQIPTIYIYIYTCWLDIPLQVG